MAISAEYTSASRSLAIDDALDSLRVFIDELAEREIDYCSWKSNEHLDAALGGHTDLDLLVARAHAHAFREVAASHGLMASTPTADFVHPGMEHYLGLDAGTGRLFHLHVHYQLVLGEKHVKNHHVPIEHRVLDSAREVDGVRVPAPDVELAILVTRTLLKYRGRDVVKDVLGIRHPGIPIDTQTELRWLMGQTSRSALPSTIESDLAPIPSAVVCDFLDGFERAPRDGRALLRQRSAMRAALRSTEQRGRLRTRAEYLRGLWRQRNALRQHRSRPLTPAAGGATVAFVGADGSGKSTTTETVEQWLGWKLETRRYYMGSKEPSRRSRALYLGFRALRRSQRSLSARLEDRSLLPVGVATARDVMLAAHSLSIGRDRARRHALARRAAGEGAIVIFDRYPLEAISTNASHRLLDGPHIEAVTGGAHSRVTRVLSDIEKRYYERFGLPDHLVVLDVDAETAIARKPDHQFDVIATKAQAVRELAWAAERRDEVNVIRIDARRDLEEVLAETRRRVWHVL